jgi:hypothetical protein
MAEAPRNDLDPPIPPGVLAGLASVASRPDEVARARAHAEARAFDDDGVVEEIATQLLLFSRR